MVESQLVCFETSHCYQSTWNLWATEVTSLESKHSGSKCTFYIYVHILVICTLVNAGTAYGNASGGIWASVMKAIYPSTVALTLSGDSLLEERTMRLTSILQEVSEQQPWTIAKSGYLILVGSKSWNGHICMQFLASLKNFHWTAWFLQYTSGYKLPASLGGEMPLVAFD